MGYRGARLAPLFNPGFTRITARRMAHHGAEHWHGRVVMNTPIDDGPYPSRAPGTARRMWRVKPVKGPITTLSAEVYESGVETEDKITLFLETGTGLYGPLHRYYYIFPKHPGGMLRFWSRRDGRWVFAKYVKHPGIHAQRPLAIGTAITEHELAAVLRPDMEEGVRLAENSARLAARVHA